MRDEAHDAHPDVVNRVVWQRAGTAIVACTSECPAGSWGREHVGDRDGIALPVRGAWRRRTNGVEHFVSPASGFFRRAGEITEVAHFAAERHTGTIIDIDPDVTSVITESATTTGPFVVTPPVHAAHRLLVASLRAPVTDLEVEERTFALVAAVVTQRIDNFGHRSRRAASQARRRVAHDVCEHLHRTADLSLPDLARAVHYSPFHLSRLFREEVGTTLSGYRRSLQVQQVVLRLEAGERDLHRLAAETGFADHSHMTRTLVTHLGRTPSALRAELAAFRDQRDRSESPLSAARDRRPGRTPRAGHAARPG